MPRLLLFAVLAACTPAGLLRAQAAPVELVWTHADSVEAQRGAWRGQPTLRATLPTLRVDAHVRALTDVRLELQPAGPVAVVREVELSGAGGGARPQELAVEVEVSPGERASLTATLHARTGDGGTATWQATLFIVSDDTTLYLSRVSFATVELRRLRAARDAGYITAEQFEVAVRALLVQPSVPAAREPR